MNRQDVVELLTHLANGLNDRGSVNDDFDQGRRDGLAEAERAVRQAIKELPEWGQHLSHLEVVTEARKCCHFLADTGNEHQPIEVERLIDAADQLADRYADKFLSHLSKEERHKAEEETVAAQARKVMDYIVEATK